MRQEEDLRKLAQDEEEVIETGGLPPFWKPEQEHEEREGRLMAVRALEKGDVLHVRTRQGMIGVPVSTTMAEVDFRAIIGKDLRFTFEGTADTKSGYKVKLFRIAILRKKDDEDVPF